MSAGLGTVPPEQTYLDIGQGNRVFDSLYDTDLPPGAECRWIGRWKIAAAAAAGGIGARADIVPRASGRDAWPRRREGVRRSSTRSRSAQLPSAGIDRAGGGTTC